MYYKGYLIVKTIKNSIIKTSFFKFAAVAILVAACSVQVSADNYKGSKAYVCPESGKVFHGDKDCSVLRSCGASIVTTTAKLARQQGYTLCDACSQAIAAKAEAEAKEKAEAKAKKREEAKKKKEEKAKKKAEAKERKAEKKKAAKERKEKKREEAKKKREAKARKNAEKAKRKVEKAQRELERAQKEL